MIWFYDIELFPNYLLFKFKNREGQFKTFKLSLWQNDIPELRKWAQTWTKESTYLVGFNIIHYDNLILKYVLSNNRFDRLPLEERIFSIWEFSQYIINDKKDDEEDILTQDIQDGIISQLSLFPEKQEQYFSKYRGDNYDRYKSYKYEQNWTSIDLYLYWSKLIRQSRMISLKSLACHLNWPWIKELPLPFYSHVTREQIPDIDRYCENDVNITERLAEELKDEINFRWDLKQTSKLDCLSYDGVKIGTEIVLNYLENQTGLPKQEIRGHKTFHKSISLKGYIPDLQFNSKIVQDFYDFIINRTFNSSGSFDYTIMFRNPNGSLLTSVLGVGGIHGITGDKVFIPQKGYVLIDEDVDSLYPTFAIEWGFFPAHFPSQTQTVFKSIRTERLDAKAKKIVTKDKSLKLGLNGSIGQMRNSYSPFYDPKPNLAICIMGQLAILRATELAINKGLNVIMQNTDGLTFYCLEGQILIINSIIQQVCEEFRVTFSRTQFSRLYANNINNYLAFKMDGSVKPKGWFVSEPVLENSHDYLAIPKALQAYLKDGTDCAKTLRSLSSIYDFTAAYKVSKKYQVFWKGEQQQNLNRFFPSKEGANIYKRKLMGKELEHLHKESPVELLNLCTDENASSYNINYGYFIDECTKILEDFQPKLL